MIGSPVYKAQCRSFKLAREMCGVILGPNEGLATSGNHVLATFRAKPAYRSPEAQALRDTVAAFLKCGIE